MNTINYVNRAPSLLAAAALALSSTAAPARVHKSKPEASVSAKQGTTDPLVRIGRANATARVEPERSSYFNAIQQYGWAEGALFQIYTAPGQITDIALEIGEKLVGPGPVASGDTVRWIIGDTISGSGDAQRIHILVKPTRADIMTNLVINTDRRTYHLELRATTSTYMAGVSWVYPQDALIALHKPAADQTGIVSAINVAQLEFGYRISGDRPDWRPIRVFDDGQQVFVEFDDSIKTTHMPPLFVLGPKDAAELVNYRVEGRFMIIDRLFERAELRLGSGKAGQHVRIERASQSRRSRS